MCCAEEKKRCEFCKSESPHGPFRPPRKPAWPFLPHLPGFPNHWAPREHPRVSSEYPPRIPCCNLHSFPNSLELRIGIEYPVRAA